MPRTPADVLAQQAEATFVDVCRDLGFRVDVPAPGSASCDVLLSRDGASWSVELTARAVADGLPPDGSLNADVLVVVADVVTARVREAYERLSISWLDRRGHLRLIGTGLDIDTPLDPSPRAPAQPDGVPRRAIAGRGGLEVAVALLLAPREPLEVRRLARRVGMAPSTISTALARLRAASLVTPSNRPLVPELFWELVANWEPTWVWLRQDPGVSLIDATLVRTGDVAAAALGAPLVTGPRPRGAWYVGSPRDLERLTESCGVAVDDWSAAARVAVAPSAQIALAAQAAAAPVSGELLAPSLVVALDLAGDPGRGQEILEAWRPKEGVWHR